MRRRNAFTLVEILVVIGIIAILISLLLPVIIRSRAQAEGAKCQSNLRQLYFAQNYFADNHRGRYATSAQPGLGIEGWEEYLRQFLAPKSGDVREILRCPSLKFEGLIERASYGANSCLILPNWQARRERKMNQSEIILMGEKPPNGDDHLVTEDRYFLTTLGDGQAWFIALQHNSASTYRHSKGTRANMLMADGHVTSMDRTDLLRDSGHWYVDPGERIDEYEYAGPCCE